MGLAGWVFVLAGIASFLAFKGTTGLVTVSICTVGFVGSAYLDHRQRNREYGRGSETVRPMSRSEARQYVKATNDGMGRVPDRDDDPASGRTWVSAHDRTGTDGVTGYYRERDSEQVRDREREQAAGRAQDAKTRTRVKSRASWIEGEWWEGGE